MIGERTERTELDERFNFSSFNYFATNVFEQEPYKSVFANNIFEPSIFTKEPFIGVFKRGL